MNGAVVLVLPGATLDYNVTTITGTWDTEATLTAQISPASDTDGLVINLTNFPNGGLTIKAHIDQLATLPPVTDIENLNKRLMPGVSLTVTQPVIINGRPVSPTYALFNDTTFTLRTDTGHLTEIDDPNPVWDSANSKWIVNPPPSGVGDYRWTVNSLPDPALYGGTYPLGVPLAADNTLSMPASTQSWKADTSTPSGPAWNAVYPFKPTVTSYTHQNQDGSAYFMPKAVQFNMHFAQHMFMDMGTAAQNMPFTWILVAQVLDFPGGNYKHTLLDAGRDPRLYGNVTIDNASIDRKLPGAKYEGLNYRTMIQADRDYMYVEANVGTPVHVKHPAAPKPKMYYGVFTNTKTPAAYIGNISPKLNNSYKTQLKGLDVSHRYYVMGRPQSLMGVSYGAHMLMYELRYWHRALTQAEIAEQYTQLSSTWKFVNFQ